MYNLQDARQDGATPRGNIPEEIREAQGARAKPDNNEQRQTETPSDRRARTNNTRTQPKPQVQEPKLTRGGHNTAWTQRTKRPGPRTRTAKDRPYKGMRRNEPARVDGRTTKERRIRPYKKMRRSGPARARPRQRRDNEREQQRRDGLEQITPYMEMRRTTCMHRHAQMRRREGSDRYGPGSAI